jgi:hypothetical protein
MALGAARGEIAGLVLRESLMVGFVGLGAGTLGAIAATCLLPTEGIGWSGSGIFLYGVSRTDSLTYFGGRHPAYECGPGRIFSPVAPRSESRPDGGAAIRVGRYAALQRATPDDPVRRGLSTADLEIIRRCGQQVTAVFFGLRDVGSERPSITVSCQGLK